MKSTKINSVSIIFIIICIFLLSCKKDSITDNTKSNSVTPQTISTATIKNDSLQQFGKLFKLLSISNGEFSGGVTVLALTDNALINPSDPENLKDYVLKGIITPSDLTNGKSFTSITGKQIVINVQNGQIFANGSMISYEPVITNGNFNVYAISGYYNSNPSGYDDPHSNEYYVEYYENGIKHSLKGRKITSWQFFNSNNFPIPGAGNCSYPTYDVYSSGPSEALQAFAAENPFCMQINRHDFGVNPVVGDYQISKDTYNTAQNRNSGNCNLIINGATFSCNTGDDDSYVHINVSEVKVDQDLGLEKRGYYKGEFDAILYFTARQGSAPEKRTITSGRFMVPMGNNELCALNGSAPVIDRFAILTTGKWYWRPTVEKYLNDPNHDFAPCNLDDFIVFRTDGTCDMKDGGTQCGNNEGAIDYDNNIPWKLTDNQTVIHFGPEDGDDIPITSISESTLVLGGLIFAHGN